MLHLKIRGDTLGPPRMGCNCTPGAGIQTLDPPWHKKANYVAEFVIILVSEFEHIAVASK